MRPSRHVRAAKRPHSGRKGNGEHAVLSSQKEEKKRIKRGGGGLLRFAQRRGSSLQTLFCGKKTTFRKNPLEGGGEKGISAGGKESCVSPILREGGGKKPNFSSKDWGNSLSSRGNFIVV